MDTITLWIMYSFGRWVLFQDAFLDLDESEQLRGHARNLLERGIE